LIKRTSIDDATTGILIGLLGALTLFISFLAKESAYWVLPLWVIAFSQDFRGGIFSILLVFRDNIRNTFIPGIFIAMRDSLG
jgi:hypothetical protein